MCSGCKLEFLAKFGIPQESNMGLVLLIMHVNDIAGLIIVNYLIHTHDLNAYNTFSFIEKCSDFIRTLQERPTGVNIISYH